jgi:class 3 adenylate cyclase/DNA-binding SARP family transcriptional activator/tetratricopeptide (TPR) repeat protein
LLKRFAGNAIMTTTLERSISKVILFADLYEYSRLVADNEIETLSFVQECFRLFREESQKFQGEFVKTTGDGVLILFDTAPNAIEFAIHIQSQLRMLPTDLDEGAQFRIGLHIGTVFRSGGDVYGHAINLAARLEGVADPGGVCISQQVYEDAQNKSKMFRSGGRITLKNIPEPVSVYHLVSTHSTPHQRPVARCLVSTIDGLSLTSGDGAHPLLKSGKARALMGVLALSARLQETYERLAALLWPQQEHSEGRRAVTRCLATIEKSLAGTHFAPITRHGDLVRLDPAQVDVDLQIIQHDLNLARIDGVLQERADWAESILLGLEDASPLFTSWLSVARRNWHDRISGLLEGILDRLDKDDPVVRQAASALLLTEPCHERAAQALIRHHSKSGNHSAARRIFDVLRQEMKTRFGLEPSWTIQEFIRDLGKQSANLTTGSVSRSRAHRPAIAVGAIESRSAGNQDMAFGFRADLIANLSRFREWTIVETEADVPGPSADYLVAGTCTPLPGGIEFRIVLSKPGPREVLWSDAFVLTATSWTETQRLIVGRIASSLEIYVSHDRLSRTVPDQPETDVYDTWVRGEHLLTHWTPAAEDEAARLFESVISQDPNFAPGYASLASVYSSRHLVRPGVMPDAETSERSLDLSNRAIDLDPLSARGQLTVAWATAMVGRFSQAEVHYQLAAELNPNSPRVLISAAVGFAFMGHPDTARLLLDRATTLSPIYADYQWSYIATTRFLLGDFKGTIEAAERSRNIIIDTPGWTAAAFLQLSRRDEAALALSELQKAISANWFGEGHPTTEKVVEWFLAAFPIRRDEDRQLIQRLRELL